MPDSPTAPGRPNARVGGLGCRRSYRSPCGRHYCDGREWHSRSKRPGFWQQRFAWRVRTTSDGDRLPNIDASDTTQATGREGGSDDNGSTTGSGSAGGAGGAAAEGRVRSRGLGAARGLLRRGRSGVQMALLGWSAFQPTSPQLATRGRRG
jgi:hypothetical protein